MVNVSTLPQKFKSEHIAILLATYNGMKFIPELIDSLMKQTITLWDLYVQDDLSQDGTMEYLSALAAQDDRIHIVPNDRKLGAMLNFMSLLNVVDAQYYMFCDQDDVWQPNKIELIFSKMKTLESQHSIATPIIVHTDLTVVDENLAVINNSFMQMSRINPGLLKKFNQQAGHNLVTGCTMMLNRASALSVERINDTVLMHDAWVLLCTLKNGGIVQEIMEPTILYRQHGNNTLGAHDISSNYILKRLTSFKSVWKENCAQYKMLKSLGYGNILKYIYFKLRYFILNLF